MRRKLPPEAYAYYLSLGPSRSYASLAEHFGVNKRTVTARAEREQWQERLKDFERQFQMKAEEHARESIDAMTERHLKMVQVVERRLLEGMRSAPIGSGSQAVRALLATIATERSLRGAPDKSESMTPMEYADRVRLAMAEMKRVTHGEPLDTDEPRRESGN